MNRKMQCFQKCDVLLFFYTFLVEFGSLQEHYMCLLNIRFALFLAEQCLRNNSSRKYMEGYLSKKSIHINESFVHAIALALW